EFERCTRDDFHETIEERFWLSATAIMAQVCTGLGDVSRACVLYARLWPYRDQGVPGGRAATYLGAAARLLGLLAATIVNGEAAPEGDGLVPVPDRDAAIRHFEAAIAFDTRMGARPWVALAQCDLGEFLLGMGSDATQTAHRHDPWALLDAALAAAHDLGMA